jgi:cobalt/nickel transport system ATP-binding protein
MMIEIRNLTFSYSNSKTVLNGLDFVLRKGDRVGLTGPNGSGKTTLFHLIMGLLRPVSGEIWIFGKKRENASDFTDVRERIGLMFQDSDDQLFCPTVEEDIAFGPLNLGKSHPEAKKIVKETCEMLGLQGFEKRITHRLSGGEKRLVALATVVAMRPECYLLDEPVAGLDEEKTEQVRTFLKAHADTYIIISHDQEFLKDVVDTIQVIERGRMKTIWERST